MQRVRHLFLVLCSLLVAFNLNAQQSVGYLDSWPKPNGQVNAIAVSGNIVYIGGKFTSVGGQSRNRLAAIDATTGTLTSWNPNVNDYVQALVVSGSTVYAGGYFTTIGGQSRNYIAAINAATGNITAWNPNASSTVLSLAVSGNTVYAGGWFNSIGGQSRSHIAAIDAATGNATAWNPNSNGDVNTIAVKGNTIYVGGSFTSIGGQSRINMAALDDANGNATTWNPNPYFGGGAVYAMIVSGSTVYVGGDISFLGSLNNALPRPGVAAIDATTGTILPWNPNGSNAPYGSSLKALAVSGNTVYAGGWFSSIGGQSRNNIAAIDVATGNASTWNPSTSWNPSPVPGINDRVYALAVNGSTIYAGGAFTSMGGNSSRQYFMALVDSNTIPPLTITSLSVSGPVCQTSAFTVNFTANGSFNAGNVFTLQRSDASGSFASPVTLGTLNGTTSGTISASLGSTPAGTRYRFRVVSSSPALVGPDNGSNIVVAAIPGSAQMAISPAAASTICAGNSVTLSVPATAGATYQWLAGATAITGATSNSYVASPMANTNYRCVVTNANGCARTSVAKTVTLNAAPTATVSPATVQSICAGNSVMLRANTGTGLSYQWNKDGMAISGANSATYAATDSGAYSVTVTGSNGCSRTSAATAVTLSTCPLTITSVSANSPFCQTSAFTVAFDANGSYNAGNVFTLQRSDATGSFANPLALGTLSGTTSGTINASLGSTPAGTRYRFRVVSSSPALVGPDNGSNIVVTAIPSSAQMAISPAAASTICAGNSVTLSVPATAGATYQWLAGTTAITGATSNSYVASPMANTAYRCVVTNANGCARTSTAKTVTVNAAPAATVTPSGPQTLCGNTNSIQFSVATGTGYSYQWNNDNGAIAGATDSIYSATTPGNYTVTVTSANGCSVTSTAVPVVLCSITIDYYADVICDLSGVAYYFSAPSGAYGPNNQFNLELSDINGSFVNPTPLSNLGFYLMPQGSGYPWTHYATAGVPICTPASSNYQMRINTTDPVTYGNPVPLTINTCYCGTDGYNRPAGDGTSADPAGNSSAPITHYVLSATQVDMKVYPNPSSSTGTLLLQSSRVNEQYSVRITDITGRVVEQLQGVVSGKEASFGASLAPGVYSVEATNGSDQRMVKKWIKQ